VAAAGHAVAAAQQSVAAAVWHAVTAAAGVAAGHSALATVERAVAAAGEAVAAAGHAVAAAEHAMVAVAAADQLQALLMTKGGMVHADVEAVVGVHVDDQAVPVVPFAVTCQQSPPVAVHACQQATEEKEEKAAEAVVHSAALQQQIPDLVPVE